MSPQEKIESKYGSRVVGTGGAFPERIMANSEFETFLDTSDEWIRTRTGIETRHIADTTRGENTLSLAHRAALNALDQAKLTPSDLDLIIVGTVTPDSVMPTTANQLQRLLGARQAFSFDLQAACSGFVYGLTIADQFMKSGAVKNALIIGAETLSTLVDWTDRSTCVLFGDGAGAMVISRTETPHRIIGSKLYSDGSQADLLTIAHGFSRVPPYSPEYKSANHKIRMKGGEIFKHAVRNMVEASTALLREHDVKPEDVDFFIFHQANMRIIEMCAKTLNVPPEKMWNNVSKYGNTSAATLPVCLDEALKAGKVKPNDLVLMATFGGGLTWASALIRM